MEIKNKFGETIVSALLQEGDDSEGVELNVVTEQGMRMGEGVRRGRERE